MAHHVWARCTQIHANTQSFSKQYVRDIKWFLRHVAAIDAKRYAHDEVSENG